MPSPAELITLLNCIDLTDLNIKSDINALCEQAVTPHGPVAAVCVYPDYVSTTWQALITTPVKIATVINFPGTTALPKDIPQAILDGAVEIDAVMPHDDNGDFVSQCKYYCGDKALLKIILESGEIDPDCLYQKSLIALEHGADFLKTSTGKTPIGATPEAATIILNAIKQYQSKTAKLIGFKASGHIRTLNDALVYVNLVRDILGVDAYSPHYFRIGASRLLQDILCAFPKQN